MAVMFCETLKEFSICTDDWNVLLGSLHSLCVELVPEEDGVCAFSSLWSAVEPRTVSSTLSVSVGFFICGRLCVPVRLAQLVFSVCFLGHDKGSVWVVL